MKTMLFLVWFLLPLLLPAKIIEAKQLFNKKVISVVKKEIRYQKSFYAEVRLNESKVYDVALRFDGFIEQLYMSKNYTKIKKHQKLFSIYSDEIYLLLKELRYLHQKSTYQKLQNLGVAKSEYKKEKIIDIYAKYDGYLIEKKIHTGSFVKKGERLFQIANINTLWVIAKVYQEDLPYIKRGILADIEIEGVGVVHSKVDFIYPYVDRTNKSVDVRFVIENKEERIYPNMFAKVSLTYRKKMALVLPKSAVLTKGKKHYLFLDKGDTFEPKEIEARRLNAYEFEILSGVTEGVKVVDKAMFMLDSDALTNGMYTSDDEEW